MAAMRTRLIALVLALAAASLAALADEQGFTNRATELKEKASADSATVASLPESTPVKVLARGGAWTHVEAAGKTGWVRVFHLRFAGAVETSSGGGLASLGSALGFGAGQNSQARLASTGIRGLSSEDVKNATPDPEALRRLQSFRADRDSAERFAREAKLAESKVAAPSDSESKGSR